MVSGARRLVLWFAATVTIVVLLMGYHTSTSAVVGSATSVLTPGGSGTATVTTTGSSTTVTGPAVATRYGPVQVQVDVTDGRLTDVSVVQYPDSNSRDAQINGQAMPILVQETLDAQSAQIQMVSGASYSSQGYLASLQAALDSAGL